MHFLRTSLIAFVLALAWSPSVWRYLHIDFFNKDTIFILSIPERTGLIILSTILFVVLMWLNYAKSRLVDRHFCGTPFRYFAPGIDMLLLLAMFMCAVAVAPQFLYTYYIVALDGLPLQWVTSWPTSTQLWQWFRMAPIDSLNTMMRGLLLWSMLAAALWYWTDRLAHHMGEQNRTATSLLITLLATAAVFVLR